VIKQIENSKVTRWTWSGSRFRRRQPGETVAQGRKYTLVLICARFFDPQAGEFVSTDPLQYVDGFSLYRGYMAPSNIYPFGLKCDGDGPCTKCLIVVDG